MPFLREKLYFHSYEEEAARKRAEERAEARAGRRAQEERRILESRRRLEDEKQKTQELQNLELTAIQEGVTAPYQEPAKPWGATGTMEYRSPYYQEPTAIDKSQQLREAIVREQRRKTIEKEELPMREVKERIRMREEPIREEPIIEPTTVGGYKERLAILKEERKENIVRQKELRDKKRQLTTILRHVEILVGETFTDADTGTTYLIDTPEEAIYRLREKYGDLVDVEAENKIYNMPIWETMRGENELARRPLTPEEMKTRGLRREAPKGYEYLKEEKAPKLSLTEQWRQDLNRFRVGELTEQELRKMYPEKSKQAEITEKAIPTQPIRVEPLKVGNFWQTRKPEFADKASVEYASTLKTVGDVMNYFDNMSLLEKEGKNIREINDYITQVVIPGMTIEQKEFLRKKGYITK